MIPGIIIVILFILFTKYLLTNDTDIRISILKSYLLENQYNETFTIWFLSLLFPITLVQYIFIKKINMKNILTAIVLIALASALVYGGTQLTGKVIDFSNTEINVKNNYNSEVTNRTAIYDKMYKEISANTELSLKVDSSFKEVVAIVMSNRQDGPNLTWKWLQESNPTATYAQVAAFYRDLSVVINNNREEFLAQDKLLSSINKQHEDLIGTFPNSLYNTVLKRKSFDYIPITSTRAEEVNKTHKDDDVKVFK